MSKREAISKKQFTLAILSVIAVFFIALYLMNPALFVPRLNQLWQAILNLPNTIHMVAQGFITFMQNPAAAIGTISGAAGVIGGATTVYTKFRTFRQQSKEDKLKSSVAYNELQEEYGALETDYDSLKQSNEQLQTDKTELQNQLSAAKTDLQAKNAEVQKILSDRTSADRIAANAKIIQEGLPTCSRCKQHVLPDQRFCQFCGATLIVV